MKNIRFVKVEGHLDVVGVFNYNGVGQLKGNINHKVAKQDTNGIDFTSSRCIRHEIFKDLQPQQPASKAFTEHFLDLVASEVGLLRGFLDPDTGFKRSSPLHVADAYTETDVSVLFIDQGSSSKPKESGKKNKSGDSISDNSMFSKDNAPMRKQKLMAAINIKELQFLPFDDVDPAYRMVDKKSEEKFVQKLKKYFAEYNVSSEIEIKEYLDKSSVLKIPRKGIFLNNDQVVHLVKVAISRIASLNASKAGASLKANIETMNVVISDGSNEEKLSFKEEFKSNLEKFDFYRFYEAV